ncbi:MAG: hypothetical protein FRX49_09915 [Trebouxia sp. A1-2]|nr:MAG: hypothetical protein FRX49_09915 [Trebouxia sp. A1-2]
MGPKPGGGAEASAPSSSDQEAVTAEVSMMQLSTVTSGLPSARVHPETPMEGGRQTLTRPTRNEPTTGHRKLQQPSNAAMALYIFKPTGKKVFLGEVCQDTALRTGKCELTDVQEMYAKTALRALQGNAYLSHQRQI